MKNKCKFGMRKVIGHLMILLGIYLLSAGLINDYSLVAVLRSSIFWGIFLIITAIAHTLKATIKK